MNKKVTASVQIHQKLMKLDPTDKTSSCNYKRVDVGFSAHRSLKELVQTKKISELQEMEFRKQCQEIVSATVKKILLKHLLGYSLVRSANCFDPCILANIESIEVCKKKLKRTLDILVPANWVKRNKSDDILLEYCRFFEERVPCELERFENFEPGSDRVGTVL